jgi:anti-anti-sigma factor
MSFLSIGLPPARQRPAGASPPAGSAQRGRCPHVPRPRYRLDRTYSGLLLSIADGVKNGERRSVTRFNRLHGRRVLSRAGRRRERGMLPSAPGNWPGERLSSSTVLHILVTSSVTAMPAPRGSGDAARGFTSRSQPVNVDPPEGLRQDRTGFVPARTEIRSACTVVAPLPDEIDITNADQVGESLLRHVHTGITLLVVDMSATTFCDVAGVRAVLRAKEQARAHGAGLRVITAAAPVRRVFDLLGVDVRIYPDLETALSATIPDDVPASVFGGRAGSQPPGTAARHH